MRVTDPIVIDNLQISTLTANGDLANDAGDVLNLTFDDNIRVADDDVADDDKGFDDDLNDTLNFDNW